MNKVILTILTGLTILLIFISLENQRSFGATETERIDTLKTQLDCTKETYYIYFESGQLYATIRAPGATSTSITVCNR